MGPQGVDFWLTSFENFMLEFNGQSLDTLRGEDFFANVDYFLSIEENAQYRNDVRWSNKSRPNNITAFRALVGMKNFAKALDQMDTVDSFRNLAQNYPEYNITTFQIMWLFVDQYEEVLPNTIQEIYSGTAFMILIAVFFIPSVISSLWVALAILSIDAGMIGFMAFWGINLDVISMITIIMSIGFSVDFTAHIAYAYVVIDGKDNVERTVNALSTLAWPITQGGIATVMGVVVLAGTNSYITTAFFRTVFLVIVIGWAHALIFLPVVLSVFSCKLSTKYAKSCWSKIKIGNRDQIADYANDNKVVTVLEPADLHKFDANGLQLRQQLNEIYTPTTTKDYRVFVKIENNLDNNKTVE
uniref:Patched family protein n=1 Tax=Romanomermis culicivorax TaxID=13658 RepID=A0A915HSM3_ROMCU